MNYLVPDLMRLTKRYRVIYFDQRGSGRSSPVDHVTADVLAAATEAVRQHFKFERLTLIGHSWQRPCGVVRPRASAACGASGAHRCDACTRLWSAEVFSEPCARLTPEENARLDAASVARDKAITAEEHMEVAARTGCSRQAYYADPAKVSLSRADLCAPPAEGLASGRRANGSVWQSLGDFDWRERLGAIRVPTLVIHGDRDPIPLYLAREWRASIPASRLVVVPNAGHMACTLNSRRCFSST